MPRSGLRCAYHPHPLAPRVQVPWGPGTVCWRDRATKRAHTEACVDAGQQRLWGGVANNCRGTRLYGVLLYRLRHAVEQRGLLGSAGSAARGHEPAWTRWAMASLHNALWVCVEDSQRARSGAGAPAGVLPTPIPAAATVPRLLDPEAQSIEGTAQMGRDRLRGKVELRHVLVSGSEIDGREAVAGLGSRQKRGIPVLGKPTAGRDGPPSSLWARSVPTRLNLSSQEQEAPEQRDGQPPAALPP